MFPDSLVYDSHAEKIHIPDIMTIGRLVDIGFTNLKKVTFSNIDYIPGGLFMDNNTIEEIVFEGAISHFDCALVTSIGKSVTWTGFIKLFDSKYTKSDKWKIH